MAKVRVPFSRPLCKYPVLVVNRRAMDLMKRTGVYVFCGKEYLAPDRDLIDYRYKKFYKLGYSLAERLEDVSSRRTFYKFDYSRLAQCYVENDESFEYLFMIVGCRHCVLCVDVRRNDYVARCAFESQSSCTPPIMVTLTYAEPFLPHKKTFVHRCLVHSDDPYDKSFYTYETSVFYRAPSYEEGEGDVCMRDVQDFLKRLRIRLYRKLKLPFTNLRYLCCAEYGKEKGRPHYHFLFWNVPFAIKSQYDQGALACFKAVILDAWRMCDPDCCQVEVARSAARYCTKYMTKADRFGKKCFMLSSRGSRNIAYKGIGSKFLMENIEFYRQHPTMQCIPFLDRWNGELCEYTMGSYSLGKLFPTGSSFLDRGNFKLRYKELVTQGSYVAWLFNRITYYRTSRSFEYDNVIRNICEICWSLNFAPHYVSTMFDYHGEFSSPPDCNFDLIKSDLSSALIAQREACAYRHFYAWLDMCDRFIEDYDGVIDDGYLLYLDGLRHSHFELMTPRLVTDDMILQKSAVIEQKNAIEYSKEIL